MNDTNEKRIAPGIYGAKGVAGSAQFGKSSKKNDQVAIDLDLVTGDRVTTVLAFTEAAAPYSIDRLKALGWQGGTDTTFPGISKNVVQVEIKYETYEGKERMKADIITGGGRFTFSETMSPPEQKDFMSRLSKQAASDAPRPQAAPKPANGRAPSEPSRLPVDPMHGDAWEDPNF